MFIIKKQQTDEDAVWAEVSEAAQEAIDRFLEMREIEGAKMADDIYSRSETILDDVEFVEEKSPACVEEYRAKLYEKIKDLLADADVDDQRILTEAAIYADKIAVAEETVRLRSHIDQLRSFLKADGPIGRKMDFLVQEINREANTIGSKSQNLQITSKVLNIKSEVEKIAIEAFKALGSSGCCRIDFLIDDKKKKVYINEINSIPGSLAFYLWEPIGKDYTELLEDMINIGIKDYKKRSSKTYTFDTNILEGFANNSLKGGKGKLK